MLYIIGYYTVCKLYCRNLLKHGELELYMWPTERTRNFPKSWEDGAVLSDLNPNSSIMNNPDPGAVKLETIALPVFFPNYIPPKSLLDYADPKYSYKHYNTKH